MAGKVFGSHVDETKGWDFVCTVFLSLAMLPELTALHQTGLFLTYTQVPGNDIEKDFEMLGWA